MGRVKAFALVRPGGNWQVNSKWICESDAWIGSRVMECNAAKGNGYRVVQVKVEIPA